MRPQPTSASLVHVGKRRGGGNAEANAQGSRRLDEAGLGALAREAPVILSTGRSESG